MDKFSYREKQMHLIALSRFWGVVQMTEINVPN